MAGLAHEQRHVDASHRIVSQQPHLGPVRRTFQRPAQAQGGRRTAVTARIDRDRLHQDRLRWLDHLHPSLATCPVALYTATASGGEGHFNGHVPADPKTRRVDRDDIDKIALAQFG
jgi:hypothetical protein